MAKTTGYPVIELVTPRGWSRWFRVFLHGWRLGCCDCGLVHELELRVVDDTGHVWKNLRVEMRVRRDGPATGGIRRQQMESFVCRRI